MCDTGRGLSRLLVAHAAWLLLLAPEPARALHISPPHAEQPGPQNNRVCSADADCSLGGRCAARGQCNCSGLWSGPSCRLLTAGGAAAKNNGYQPKGGASWGGSPIRGEDGLFHMFVSYMERCGLGSWEWNSVIHHTVSRTPSGPYKFRRQVFPAFAHNPAITRAPDGTYLLYHIGQAVPGAKRQKLLEHCNHTREFNHPDQFQGRIRVAHSKSLDGPWQLLHDGAPILEGRRNPHWDSLVTNPAPLVLRNGSVLLYYRGDDRYLPSFNGTRHRKIGVAFADSWEGPYKRLLNQPIFSSLGEDPVVFENPDHTGFHMIYENKFQGMVGAHAFSEDGVRWKNLAHKPVYDLTARLDSGAILTFSRRERPQFLRDERGYPQYLFNAVMGDVKEGRTTPEESTWTFVSPVGSLAGHPRR